MPKLIRKLSEAEVRNAKPKEKPYKLCDEGGLRLLVRPSGTKVWQYPYKFHGKTNTYTLGQYCHQGRTGYLGTAQARKQRDEIKELIEQGIDPNKHKKTQRYGSEEKAKTTFEAIGREWYSRGTWVPKHAKNILRSLEGDVFPIVGYKQINQITTQDIIHVLSIRSPHKPISDVTLLKLIQILGYTGDAKITPHGFRHTASTILNEHRFDRDIIEKQLAHEDQNSIRGTYNHAEYLPARIPLRQAHSL